MPSTPLEILDLPRTLAPGERFARHSTAWRLVRLLICFAVAFGVAWLHMRFLLQTRVSNPNDLLRDAGIVFVVSTILWIVGIWRVLPRRSMEMLILAVTGATIFGAVQWNMKYRTYAATLPSRHEAFRSHMNRAYTPIYGEPVPYKHKDIALAGTGGLALAGGGLLFIFKPGRRRRKLAWAALFASQAIAIACFAKTDETTRLGPDIAGYMNFKPDVARFSSIPDMLRNYVGAMPTLGWFDHHYPPGNLMLFWIQYHWHILHFTKSVVILETMLSALPLYWLCREMRIGEIAARVAVVLYGCSVAVVMYPTVNTTSLIALPTALFVAAIVRAISRAQRWPAVVAGAAVLAFWILSFSWIVIGGVVGAMVAIALLLGRVRFKNIVMPATWSLGTLIAGVAVLWIVFGFNLVACTQTGVRQHAMQMSVDPFRPMIKWLIRSSGNVLAYLLSLGPLLGMAAVGAGVSMLGRGVRPRLAAPLFIATWLAVLGAGFGGLFCLETERVWVFFTPLLAAAAGYAVAMYMNRPAERIRGRRAAPDRFVILTAVLCAAAFVAAFELILRPYK